uniref:Uncharacterized protein n=1 Tax=Glossina pallidipes TaxID=7398 RepID=A0A1A9ZTX0_GLOPL
MFAKVMGISGERLKQQTRNDIPYCLKLQKARYAKFFLPFARRRNNHLKPNKICIVYLVVPPVISGNLSFCPLDVVHTLLRLHTNAGHQKIALPFLFAALLNLLSNSLHYPIPMFTCNRFSSFKLHI